MADVIKEFLVGLGFKVDDVQYRRMMDSVGKVTGHVVKFGSEATATAFAVEAGVEKIARQFSDLYYQSQLSNAPVRSLMQLRYAAGQTGLSADQATSALEGLAAALRTNPGTEGFLQSLGVHTRQANGELRDTQKIMDDLVTNLKTEYGPQNYFVAAQIAKQFGIDERTFRLMWLNNDRRIAQEKELARLQQEMGFNADAASKKFTAFDRNVQHLWATFETAGYKVAYDFLPDFNAAITGISDAVEWLGKENVKVGNEWGPIAQKLVEGAEAVGIAFGGWKLVLTPLTRMLLRIIGLGPKANAAAKAAATAGASEATATSGTVAAAEGAGTAASGGALAATAAVAGVPALGLLSAAKTFQEGKSGAPLLYVDPWSGIPVYGDEPTTAFGPPTAHSDNWFRQQAAKLQHREALPEHDQSLLRLMDLTKRYESKGHYNIGFGGIDLTNAPHDKYGFPIWPGEMGPSGISHAAGAYQFEPRTWDEYARKLGIHDFSPASQDRVFQAAVGAEGMRPWESDRPLMAALSRMASPRREISQTVTQNITVNVEGGGDPNVAAVAVKRAVTNTSAELGQALRNNLANLS